MPADGPTDMEVSDPASDSDSDFEEVDASPEDMDLMMQLETDLQSNPNLYDSHVQVILYAILEVFTSAGMEEANSSEHVLQYIRVLRKCKLREKLRAARKAMQEHYPLTEQLWLEWLQDEISSAESATSKKQIDQLFQKAVQDYLSVPIWKAYIE